MQEHIAFLSPVTVVTQTTIARSRILDGTVALFAVTMFTVANLFLLNTLLVFANPIDLGDPQTAPHIAALDGFDNQWQRTFQTQLGGRRANEIE